MGIEDLKRWHWIVIGLLLGLAISYTWTGLDPEIGRNNAVDFLRDVTAPVDAKIGPIVKSIVVHPPQGDFRAEAALQSARRREELAKEADAAAKKPPAEVTESRRAEFIAQRKKEAQDARAEAAELRRTADQNQINIVSYKRLKQKPDGTNRQWVQEQFIAEVPFRGGQRGGDAAPNVAEYLKGLEKQYPSASFSYAWWEAPKIQYAMWTTGSVIAVGVLWPNVLNALLGAGYGRKRDPSAKKKDSLWSYQSRPEPKQAAKPKSTAEGDQRLRDMTDQLERDLAGVAGNHGDNRAVAGAATVAQIRKLDGAPLDASPVSAREQGDEIEVKHGEYYDVILHHQKHAEQKSADKSGSGGKS